MLSMLLLIGASMLAERIDDEQRHLAFRPKASGHSDCLVGQLHRFVSRSPLDIQAAPVEQASRQ